DLLYELRQAVQERRIVEFDYQPSRDDDDDLRHHCFEPYEVYPREGHLYLRGYSRYTVSQRYGERPGKHYNLRVGRIIMDSFTHSDEHFIVERPHPEYPVHYILSRKLAKDGGSTLFRETQRETLPDGRIEIHAHADDPFEAMRKLLGYGA